MLTRNPSKVIAVDMNPAQLACVELRVAGFKCLEHPELLELIGSRPSERRTALYHKCEKALSDQTRHFWQNHPQEIENGIGAAGKGFAHIASRGHAPIGNDRDVTAGLFIINFAR